MLRSARQHAGSGDAGQSIVETALVLPFLLVLIIGTVEAARLLLATIALTTAVTAGAQYGALYPENASDTAGIDAAVRTELAIAGATATNPVVTSTTGEDDEDERYVRVQATFTWTSLVAYPGLPRSVDFTRAALLQVHR